MSRQLIRATTARERHAGTVAERAYGELHVMEVDVLLMADGAADDRTLPLLQLEPQIVGQLGIKDGAVRPRVDEYRGINPFVCHSYPDRHDGPDKLTVIAEVAKPHSLPYEVR